jgi:hypothetical protein
VALIYRPQFAFQTKAGFQDEQFHYSFDSTNVPALGVAIAGGAYANNIVLQLQNDAEFILRSIKVQTGTTASNLYLTIKDPFGNYLSAVPLPLTNYLTAAGGAVLGQLEVPFEADIQCPLGGFFELFFYNPTAAPITPPSFTLYGVNRRQFCGRIAA